MKIKILAAISLLVLTACTANRGTPTPAIVPPGQNSSAVVNALPTLTPIPPPSPTPALTPFPLPATATPTPTTASLKPRAEVIVAALNVRRGPGINYPVIDTVPAGDRLKVTGVSPAGDWLQVVTGDVNPGWVSGHSTYVRLLAVRLDELPIVEPPPPPSPALAAAATIPSDTGSGRRGKVVFMTGSGGDLFVVNVDGTGLRRLAGAVIDPVLSPDGRQVAFTRWDGAEFGALYTINLDGGGERAVVGDIRQPKSPTWSPDGQKIIISFQHGGRRDPLHNCKNYDFDDGIHIPADAEITKVHVGENGITICYILHPDLQWILRQVDLSTGSFDDLPSDEYAYNPTWDPQHPWRVIYDGNKGLMQFDLTNGSHWPITTDLRDTGPVFSPDGKNLALTYKQHDHWETYTIDLETGLRRRLTKPPILADPQYNSAAPAWSPDGSRLAFVTDRTGQWEIWVMNADGSDQQPLFAPEMQARLSLEYRGVNERMLNWTD